MRRRTPKGSRLRLPACPTPDYVYAACVAREKLGIAALAEELGLTPEHIEALIQAIGNKDVYEACLDRGDVILATRAELPVSRVEAWISDGCKRAKIAACPPAELRRVLDALQETVH
jgi:hypothetical protein